jgi:hypothetical protein
MVLRLRCPVLAAQGQGFDFPYSPKLNTIGT